MSPSIWLVCFCVFGLFSKVIRERERYGISLALLNFLGCLKAFSMWPFCAYFSGSSSSANFTYFFFFFFVYFFISFDTEILNFKKFKKRNRKRRNLYWIFLERVLVSYINICIIYNHSKSPNFFFLNVVCIHTLK